MGVILYLVLYGQFPSMPAAGEATADSMKQAIKQDVPPLRFERSKAQTALSLVKLLLVRNPRDRVTASSAAQHPFVARAAQPSGTEMEISEVAEKLRDFKVSGTWQGN
eukprot:Skav202133  [mRNA]  locus=scaffold929:130962:132748:- [translate_table: standard]